MLPLEPLHELVVIPSHPLTGTNMETDCSEEKKKPNKDLQNEKTQKQGQGRANWSSVTFQRGQQSKPTPLNKEYIALIITVCLALTFAAVLPKL